MAWISYTTTHDVYGNRLALQGGMRNVWKGVYTIRRDPLARQDENSGGHTKITGSFYLSRRIIAYVLIFFFISQVGLGLWGILICVLYLYFLPFFTSASGHSIHSIVDVRHAISARLVRLVIYFCVFIGAGDMTGLYRFHTLHRLMCILPSF